jgi:hypothetical protein
MDAGSTPEDAIGCLTAIPCSVKPATARRRSDVGRSPSLHYLRASLGARARTSICVHRYTRVGAPQFEQQLGHSLVGIDSDD